MMTEPELLALYTDYTLVVVTYVGMIITILSAYLIANYLAAKSLNWIQFTLLTCLFLIISTDLANNVRVHEIRLSTLETEIIRRAEVAGSDISFVGTEGLGESNPLLVFSFWVTVSFISVIFSLQARISDKGAV